MLHVSTIKGLSSDHAVLQKCELILHFWIHNNILLINQQLKYKPVKILVQLPKCFFCGYEDTCYDEERQNLLL